MVPAMITITIFVVRVRPRSGVLTLREIRVRFFISWNEATVDPDGKIIAVVSLNTSVFVH